ncbi:MAG: helix-turn-helix domain-containing protein [Clostridia bacterium]|nr:helix-turn-helix domain-containing protein [Clostridia bacterium]MDE6758478.1 helix-turn-helix domain-containing protein [Clostridia bacterium]
MTKRKVGTCGYKIYMLRKENGYTQWQLGKRIGVSRQTISHWESNKNDMKTENMKQLCEVFDVDVKYFVGEREKAVTNDVNVESVASCEVEEKVETNVVNVEAAASCEVEEKVETNDVNVEVAACCEVEEKVELNEPVQQEVASQKKLTAKSKKLIIALSVCFVLFVVFLANFIKIVSVPEIEGLVVGDRVSSTTFNFSPENIAKILIVAVVIVAVCVAVHLILEVKKNVKKSKRD